MTHDPSTHGPLWPRPVIQLFLDLCQICQATRGRKRTQKIVHKPIIPDAVGQRGQADLVDLQMIPDNGYKFILNYCLSKYVILRPLRDGRRNAVSGSVSCLMYSILRKNTTFHSGINCTPFSVYFGRKPADLVADLTLPSEIMSGLETEDQLNEVLECRQVIEFVPLTSSAATPLSSPSPLLISHLTLHEPASEAEVDRRTGSSQAYFSYDEALISEYASSQPHLPEDILDADSPSILSPLLHTSSMPAATDDNSYDIMVPPLIGNTASTPYFNLTTGITLSVRVAQRRLE